jgi:hypothetical protein
MVSLGRLLKKRFLPLPHGHGSEKEKPSADSEAVQQATLA